MLFNSILQNGLTLVGFLVCTGVSLALGILTALVFSYKNRMTASFALTLALLPAVVQLVIMLVNGNIGTGVAIAGAFGLVRFRSAPGKGREIAGVFLAMAIGLATGMGYVAAAGLFFAIMAVVILVLTGMSFCGRHDREKLLKITIPEALDYEGLFDDLLEKYTDKAQLVTVKTVNLGTLFELVYEITLKDGKIHKEFLDGIRARNGNLNVSCCRIPEQEMI